LILLLSGLTVTWSHHIIRDKKWQKPILGEASQISPVFLDNYIICTFALFLTIFLGLEFTIWQAYEYLKATFYIYDGIYGSTFYMTTGLHGLHVVIGTLFLIVCIFRMIDLHFIYNHHLGYEAAIWYWHFVDVVWIFLFLSIYCWGSGLESFFKQELKDHETLIIYDFSLFILCMNINYLRLEFFGQCFSISV
jgi:heme/copper-type cytochrome/quinol oxidase subunit 3